MAQRSADHTVNKKAIQVRFQVYETTDTHDTVHVVPAHRPALRNLTASSSFHWSNCFLSSPIIQMININDFRNQKEIY